MIQGNGKTFQQLDCLRATQSDAAVEFPSLDCLGTVYHLVESVFQNAQVRARDSHDGPVSALLDYLDLSPVLGKFVPAISIVSFPALRSAGVYRMGPDRRLTSARSEAGANRASAGSGIGVPSTLMDRSA